MYITSIKKNTGPGNSKAQLNLIDSLFGELTCKDWLQV